MRIALALFWSVAIGLSQVAPEDLLLTIRTTAPAFEPTDIPGLYARWKMTDLTTNVAVSSWVDSVSSINMAQATAGLRPTNETVGVRFGKFTNSRGLAAASAFNITNFSVWFSFKLNAAVSYGPLLVDSTWYSGFGEGYTASQPIFQFNGIFEHWATVTLANGSTYSMVYVMNNNNTMDFYTNAVKTATSCGVGTCNANWTPLQIMGRLDDTYYFDGWIREICIYTNYQMSLLQASNLFWYSTNKYGYGP